MIPQSIQQFVQKQKTRPIKTIAPKAAGECPPIPYTEYWHRAIAAILLSGRVKAKVDGFPNMTDAHRVGKEANFNPYLMERVGKFFVLGDILTCERWDTAYQPGKWADAFWSRDVSGLQQASRKAFVGFINEFTSSRAQRPIRIHSAHLDAFLSLFAYAFCDLAVKEKTWGQILLEFSQLPPEDLERLAKHLGEKVDRLAISSWNNWLDEEGQEAMLSALAICDWAYVDDAEKPEWIYLSNEARLMLGLSKPPKPPPRVEDFHVQPNRAILAGADLGPEKLVPLFRYCKIVRIDRVFEFQLKKKQMTALPSKASAAEELREVLAELQPWPDPVEDVLKAGTKLITGEVRIKGCSAIVQPENAEVLEAIRSHPRLKNYLETKPPEGYLLIKSGSDPYNFLKRCRELGFQVKSF